MQLFKLQSMHNSSEYSAHSNCTCSYNSLVISLQTLCSLRSFKHNMHGTTVHSEHSLNQRSTTQQIDAVAHCPLIHFSRVYVFIGLLASSTRPSFYVSPQRKRASVPLWNVLSCLDLKAWETRMLHKSFCNSSTLDALKRSADDGKRPIL